MASSCLYHAAASLICRQTILRSRPDVSAAASSVGFMAHYREVSRVVVLRSKQATSRFPDSLARVGRDVVMIAPDVEYWLAEDEGGFVRGDVCFFSDAVPGYPELSRNYETRLLWNYSAVVNPSVEAWSKKHAADADVRFAVQHTNRIAGSDYWIVRSTLPGLIRLWREKLLSLHFPQWTGERDQVDAALADARHYWKRKWFMEEPHLQRSLDAIAAFSRTEL